ncbi:vomeronasal type-1 receptor 4-like [Desmodus rotundus]|uniref:vomeronasal type-1 receptor 4-like n=1 Tax=Desmodus rotundus TaxID=9430 RepID=UPI0023816A4E|nr:vomeronasal type-1 receptor 4-like [Desmodus rotundus]XP_053771020.1 vomeronasal type-1 receptor 4-like [Desmodus rotundus]
MATSDWEIGIMFLLQTLFGILGNFSLLYHYLFLHLTEYRLRPADLIHRHLTVANSLVILSKAVPETMAAFGLKHFLGDIGCKLVFYIYSVSREVSVGTTCLLSVLQAITISPTNSRWAPLKAKAAKHMGTSAFFCWALHMMINSMVPVYVTGKLNNKNITKRRDYGYCSSVLHERIAKSLYIVYLVLGLFHDVFCLGLMIWASVSIALILYRHKQQVGYIHGNSLSPRSSESRGTQSILVLVSTFVSFYSLSSTFHICSALFNRPSLWLVKSTTLLAVCFPAVSPYVLMSHDSRGPWPCFAWRRSTKSPAITRKM